MRQNGTPVSHHSTHILSHIEQKVNTNGIQKTHVSFQITLTRYGLKVKRAEDTHIIHDVCLILGNFF